MKECRRCIVSGRVQGVFFRATTQTQALELGLTGVARNLPDGSVEVIACGEAENVERMATWLWQGSPLSHVDEVVCDVIHPEEFPEAFLTR